MLRDIRPYRISAICLLAIVLSTALSGCALNRRVFIESGSYVLVPNVGSAGRIKLLEVDREDRQATFYMEDGDTVVVSFSPRGRSDWPSGCPTNIGSTYMEVLDIAGGPLTSGGLIFEDPILVRDCPKDPDRIVLREDGPMNSGGSACAGVDNCFRFGRQLEAAPVLTARIVATKPSRPSTAVETEDNRRSEIELEATLQVPDTLPNGDVVKLTFSLKNISGAPIYVLKWDTPLEGIGGEIFRVRCEGQLMPYQGILVSRGDPTPEAYVLLGVGETVTAEVDLAEAYDFSKNGTYTIEFLSPKISHVASTEAEMADTLDELGSVEMPANVVAVRIGTEGMELMTNDYEAMD